MSGINAISDSSFAVNDYGGALNPAAPSFDAKGNFLIAAKPGNEFTTIPFTSDGGFLVLNPVAAELIAQNSDTDGDTHIGEGNTNVNVPVFSAGIELSPFSGEGVVVDKTTVLAASLTDAETSADSGPIFTSSAVTADAGLDLRLTQPVNV